MKPVSEQAARYIYRRPWLYPKQEEALFTSKRYGITEASTKSGKTIAALAWILEEALIRGAPGRNYWWVAPVYSQAEIAYRRAKQGLPSRLFVANETKMTLTLLNDTTIWFKSGERPDALYGEDVYAAVLDEATRLREESWHAVRSTLTATRGPLRIIGNVRGRKNWAYRMARRAEAEEPQMHYAKITAYDAVQAGVLAAEEVEDARIILPEAVWRELYLAEASEDEGNPFGVTFIVECIKPISEGWPVAWGWDLAKSYDWTVGIALDAEGNVCRFERWQGPWESTTHRIVALSGTTGGYVDSTGLGDPIMERLEKECPHLEGFKFTPPSKQQLVEGLAVAIQKREITFPDGPIVAELESFGYEYTRAGGVRYTAPEGMNDDCVCALALAVAAWKRLPHDAGEGSGFIYLPEYRIE